MPALLTRISMRPHLLEVGHRGAVGHRLTAERANFVDDLLCSGRASSAAIHVAAEVVHDDLRPQPREKQRVFATEAGTGARDDCYSIREIDVHAQEQVVDVCRAR
jgi:hypothetical protein